MDVSDDDEPDDVEGITDGYGTTQPIHTLPPDLFADSSGFTETVRAVDKEKLEAMIVAAQLRAREIDALTACLWCDEQCTLSFCCLHIDCAGSHCTTTKVVEPRQISASIQPSSTAPGGVYRCTR